MGPSPDGDGDAAAGSGSQMAGDRVDARRAPRIRPGFPGEPADPLAVDPGVIVLVDRAEVQLEFPAGPVGREGDGAPKPEDAAVDMAVLLPPERKRHLRPGAVIMVGRVPALARPALPWSRSAWLRSQSWKLAK